MNLRSPDDILDGALIGFAALAIVVTGAVACATAQSPDPKPAIDFGASLAVALCKAEAPRRGFDPKLCQVGSDFLRPFVEDAATRFAAASLEPTSFVGTAGVRSVPCAPLGGSGGGGQ